MIKHRNPLSLIVLALVISLGITTTTTCRAQGLGIDTPTPQTKLDVNGDFALRVSSKTLAAGANHNVTIPGASFVRITGPTANYTISGLAGGVDGKMVILFNNTPYTLTIEHQSVNSLAANRIIVSNEASDTIKKYGCATLIYSALDSRWVVVSLFKL